MRPTFIPVVAIVVSGSIAESARAGVRDFGWLYSTDVMPERSVDFESWVTEIDSAGPAKVNATGLWWAPVIGITDQIELAIPIETSSVSISGAPSTFSVVDYGLDLRWRLVTSDRVDKPPVAPLIRFAAKRALDDHESLWLEADVVASYESGSFTALVDLGAVAIFHRNTELQFQPGAGVSVKLTDDIHAGAELIAAITHNYVGRSNLIAVGPSLAWRHGRFWFAGSVPIGISGVSAMPRATWGIMF